MATTVQRVFEYACDVAQIWHSHLNHFLLHTCVLLSVYLTKACLANRAHTNGELEACWVNQPEAIFDCSWRRAVSMVHKDCLASRPPKHSRYGHANTHFLLSSVGTMTNRPSFLSFSETVSKQGAMIPTYAVLQTDLWIANITFSKVFCVLFYFLFHVWLSFVLSQCWKSILSKLVENFNCIF